jgi:hypothetical protein
LGWLSSFIYKYLSNNFKKRRRKMIHVKNVFDSKGWEKAEGYPDNTKIKTLRDENGTKTILLKLPKNFHMVAHTHIFNEQHMVLRGEYKSEGKVYPK